MKTKLFFGGLAMILGALSVLADSVHLYERVSVNGETYEISERVLEASWPYQTQVAPQIKGYLFVGWTISTSQEFSQRDMWGRAYDSARFILYEDTVMTANYLAADRDADLDGLPDGWEMYWFGNLYTASLETDFDKDGRTDGDEYSIASNPLFPEADEPMIAHGESSIILYNPSNYLSCTISCSPAGALFDCTVEYCRPAAKVETEAYEPDETGFAYWELNGIPQRDIWGAALPRLSFEMPTQSVTVVARVLSGDGDEDGLPDNWEMYWFGSVEKYCANDDPDGDGRDNGQELADKTSPIMAEHESPDKVVCGTSALLVYNPLGRQRFDISCDPDGVLFESSGDYVLPGTKIVTPTCDVNSSAFVYWTIDGVVQRDMFGRALDSISFVVWSNSVKAVAHIKEDWFSRMCLYWYGTEDVDEQSDTDGDGVAFIDEINAGTNPLMAEGKAGEPVSYADSEETESNLQPYEQLQGAVVDGEYKQLFLSPVAGNFDVSETFANGTQIWPVVADVNGDGLWDMLVISEQDARVFVNVGTKGNPEFEEQIGCDLSNVDLLMNSTGKLASLGLNALPSSALSATAWEDGILLVSDVEGRIWFYLNGVLQHKVWGGSYPGFAEGLMIAAVDWEGDGDVDCLCGTSAGKLMLLRDPKIGRPTNLKAKTGVDNVLLEWDPNEQCRVRGYKIFRSAADAGDIGDMVGMSSLPRHRDWPPAIADYDYRVSAFGRFYTTGNSEPIIVESPLTDPARAELGKVSLFWNNAKAFAGDDVLVSLSIENSLSLSSSGLVLRVEYDPCILSPRRVSTSGLTEGVILGDSVGNGLWTIEASAGEFAAGGGTLLTFVFSASNAVDVLRTTSIVLSHASLKSKSGADILIKMPESDAEVTIVPVSTPTDDPTIVPPYGRGDLNGDGRLTKEDLQLMARLMNGGPNVKWNTDQLNAGDYTGNGRLDQDDYKLMREDFKAKGVVGGGKKMGVL